MRPTVTPVLRSVVCLCVCVCACVRACVRVCVCLSDWPRRGNNYLWRHCTCLHLTMHLSRWNFSRKNMPYVHSRMPHFQWFSLKTAMLQMVWWDRPCRQWCSKLMRLSIVCLSNDRQSWTSEGNRFRPQLVMSLAKKGNDAKYANWKRICLFQTPTGDCCF